MRIDELLKDIPLKLFPEALRGLEIGDICADSRKCHCGLDPQSRLISGSRLAGRDDKSKTLFFAYKGSNYDNHDAAVELYKQGKVAGIVAERELDGIPTIIAEDGRKAFALACGNFFGNPDRKMSTIGVTGTNGKTTVTYLVEAIFKAAGKKTVRIGTIGADVAGVFHELDNTTPSAYDFYSMLAEGYALGADIGIAEVSSHALEQGRLYGAKFDVAIFTNITGDHLDYHGDMESYYNAKRLLFTDYSLMRVINTDGHYGRRLYDELDGKRVSYGIEQGDVCTLCRNISFDGIKAYVAWSGGQMDIASHLVGEYNLGNILAAVAAALSLGVKPEDIKRGVAALENVPGRLEKYSNRGVTAFVDYSHTDDALANALSALKKLAKGRIITIMGAGGDRDKTKRPRMGKVAQDYSDIVMVTSDNPRTEDPERIIEDILAGMERNENVYVEPDREKAIAQAVRLCKEGDVLLVAGKGHEDYQVIGTKKYPFSDSEYVKRYLGEL